MKHYGDITKLNGATLPAVDCITGGSPCQDLSVAGLRAGLAGERSGLFMEQIRVVKEMRDATNRLSGGRAIKPRYMVWENVPGAFSSNKGKDFQAVLTEIVRISEPDAPDVPMPEKGKWAKSGCLYDELGRWSVAWRLHDAQFWGVPQRRKRIALVADFGGLSAIEILFERKGLRRDFEEGKEEGKGIAGSTESGTGSAISFQERAGKPGGGKGILIQQERTGALSTFNHQSVYAIEGHVVDRDTKQNGLGIKENIAQALNATDRHAVYDAYQHHGWRKSGTTGPLTTGQNNTVRGDTPLIIQPTIYDARGNGDGRLCCSIVGDHNDRITDYTAVVTYQNVTGTLTPGAHPGSYNGQDAFNDMLVSETVGAICSTDFKGIRNQDIDQDKAIVQKGVRRLTPLECERLQGFPDNWTNIGEWTDSKGKRHKDADSPRYKALGNSIALPFWFWLLRRISAQYERPATLGSLFDGIGGFPLCWERCNGKGSALWASEIEEFPMAVTKCHFPEEE